MANLLEKANILITPTAYSDGKIHSAKPIQSLSAEKVVNGDFATDVNGWGTDSGATLTWQSDQTCLVATTADNTYAITQGGVLTSGTTYKCSLRFKPNNTGTFRVRFGGSGVTFSTTTFNVNQWNYIEFIGVADNQLLEVGSNNGSITEFYIDNVSVKEVIDSDLNFTRGSSATRVNAQGLIENVDTLGSEAVVNGDFATDSDWNKASNVTIQDGSAIFTLAPSGQQLSQSINPTIGKQYKIVYEIKSITQGAFDVSVGSDISTSFNNSVGVYTEYLTATSTNVFYIRSRGTTTGSIDNVSVKEVIDVTNIPRINYKDGVGSWLIEPQSTNKITQSQVFSGYGIGGVVVADDVIISPDGTLNGASVTDNNNGGTGVAQMFESQSVDVLSDYTFYVFAKKKSIDYIALRTDNFTTPSKNNSFFDLNLGTVVSQGVGHTAEIKDYGNGWFRCSITFTTDSVDTSGTLVMRLSDNGIDTTIIKNGTNSIYTWGWQFEKQSFATSYIPTTGSVQTRLAETASRSGLGDLIDSTQGVFYAEISALYDNSVNDLRWFSLNDNSTSNLVTIYYYKSTNTIGAQLKVGGVQVFRNDDIPITSKTDFIKIAFKWKQDDVAIYINGIKKASSTSVNSFNSGVLNRFSFDRGTRGQDFYGKCKGLAVYPLLTDEELTCLTTI